MSATAQGQAQVAQVLNQELCYSSVGAGLQRWVCRGQRAAFRSSLHHWVPGTKLRSSDLAVPPQDRLMKLVCWAWWHFFSFLPFWFGFWRQGSLYGPVVLDLDLKTIPSCGGSTVNTSTERRPRQVDFCKSEASQNYTMKPWAGSCSEDFAPRQCCALTRNRQETGMARRNPRGESGAVLCPGSSSDESPISLSTPQFSTADLYAEGSWTGKESPLSSLTLEAQVPCQIFQVVFLRKGHFDQNKRCPLIVPNISKEKTDPLGNHQFREGSTQQPPATSESKNMRWQKD